MIVPQFWAEARLRQREPGRQISVHRYGWSDTSQAAAQAHAESRAAEALKRLLAGEKLERREAKRAYNGAEGVPIREEIVERHGASIITRNAYGARCLNTPDVLFADIDFSDAPGWRLGLICFVLLALLAASHDLSRHSPGSFALGLFAAAVLAQPCARGLWLGYRRLCGGAQGLAERRLRRFLARHPQWSLRLYRTPAGLRVLATQQTFAADDPQVAAFFEAIGSDPLYVRMCLRQRCFRARLSAKPWRIGIGRHLRPRPGVWPVAAEHLPQRAAWIEDYERRARDYAACRYLKTLGSERTHPQVQPVLALHDRMSGALSARALA